MICCYLLFHRDFSDPIKCMEYYGEKRTEDSQGVTIPSQRRFICYWSDLVYQWYLSELDERKYSWKTEMNILPPLVPLKLSVIVVSTGTEELLGFKCTHFTIENKGIKYSSEAFCDKKVINRHYNITTTKIEDDLEVDGEVKIVFFYKKEFVCSFWFHTAFIIVYLIIFFL